MNPFNWSGPAFLGFYFVFALAVVGVSFLVRRVQERRRAAVFSGRLPMDPYEIAYLRGGARGALALAMFSLLGRGLLKEENGVLSRASESTHGLPAVEREVLAFFSQRDYADQALRNETLQAATQGQADSLRRAGLLPDWRVRGWLIAATCALLTSVAWIKISLALSRGRFNVGFLVLLWLLACAAVGFVHLWPRQTADGETALSALQELFPFEAPLSILPRETPEELDILAAVHGVADIPSRRIASRKDDARHDHSASGCGTFMSSCGSGGGGSSSCGGASCGGGGGCGGGGCGGCGS